MLPTTKQIAYQLAILHKMYPKNTIDELAAHLMLSPIFVINALKEGERLELFTRKKGSDVIKGSTDIDYDELELGAEISRLNNEIVRVVAEANETKEDVEAKTLEFWCRGINPMALEMAVHVLTTIGVIASYELSDPKDKKSVYTFLTIGGNEKKQWGAKQFKNIKE